MAKKLSAKKQKKLEKRRRKAVARGAKAVGALVASFAAGAITVASRDKFGRLAALVLGPLQLASGRVRSTVESWLHPEPERPKLDGKPARAGVHASRAS